MKFILALFAVIACVVLAVQGDPALYRTALVQPYGYGRGLFGGYDGGYYGGGSRYMGGFDGGYGFGGQGFYGAGQGYYGGAGYYGPGYVRDVVDVAVPVLLL